MNTGYTLRAGPKSAQTHEVNTVFYWQKEAKLIIHFENDIAANPAMQKLESDFRVVFPEVADYKG